MAERPNVPVCANMTGQGTMPDDHRLLIGVIGDYGFHPHANRAMEESDFVLFVGSSMGSVVTIGWTFPKITLNKRVAQVGINPEMMANNCKNVLPVIGDAKLVLANPFAAIPAEFEGAASQPWVDQLNALRANFWENALAMLNNDNMPQQPERVVRSFNEVLDTSGHL